MMSLLSLRRFASSSQCCSLADLGHHLYMRDRQLLRACVRRRVFVGFHGDFDLLAVVAEHGVVLAVQDEALAVCCGQVESAVHVHEATGQLGRSADRGRSAVGLLAETKGTRQQNGDNQTRSAHRATLCFPNVTAPLLYQLRQCDMKTACQCTFVPTQETLECDVQHDDVFQHTAERKLTVS